MHRMRSDKAPGGVHEAQERTAPPRCRTCNSTYRSGRTEQDRLYRKNWRESNPELSKERSKYKHIKHHYGLDREAYDSLTERQNGLCAICDTDLSQCRTVVDHDHSCCAGIRTCGSCVRGILCVTCNTGIGMLRDDYETVLKAAAYLLPSEE